MGWLFGGGGGGDEEPQYQAPYSFGPSYLPTQSFTPGEGGALGLLGAGGGTSQTPQVNSPGFVPTTGWTGAGNADFIPGAASQLLRMGKSPQYNWY